MTRLLFNSDDLGISARVNHAIIKGHQDGLLRSASLMVTGEGFNEAVQLARATPTLKVGLHLALSEASPALPASELGDLIDHDGRFFSDPAKAGIRLALSRRAKDQARKEIQRQFELFAETGIPRAHVDGHHHLHMHPFIFDQVLYWAKKMDFKRIRVAREFGTPFPPKRDWSQFFAKSLRHCVFNLLSRRNRKLVDAGLFNNQCDGILGLWETGQMSEDYLLKAIPMLPEGDWEVYFHLGAEGGEDEMTAILSPKVRDLIQRLKIELL